MAASVPILVLQVVAGSLSLYFVWEFLASPLRDIPGPFIARFTDLWRLFSALSRQPEIVQRKLHDKYGPAVRLGPNMVSISDPAMIATIYSRKTILEKGDFYKVHDLNVDGNRVENLFSTRNEQMNTQILRPVLKLYSMGHMVKLEPLIDKTILYFLQQLSARFVDAARPCDIDKWLLYCAWDVIGDITFSERLGFLEQGNDVLDMLAINRSALDYVSVVGMMPWLDMCLERNPIKRIGPQAYAPAVNFATERIEARRSGKDRHDVSTPDLLDGFIEAQKENPQDISENAVLAYVFANVVAGSDTVAAELRTAIYYLCKSPQVLARLQDELDEAKVSMPVTWSQCHELPYLCACVSEAFRILPGVGLPLERRLGPQGMVLSDGKTFIPPGTLVGTNPFVINRDQNVYGPDVNSYRPERWLRAAGESEMAFENRLSRMKATDLTFGAGKRICIGRNLALIECHKIIASLFLTFDVKLVDPDKEWTTHNAWLMRQNGMDVYLKQRKTSWLRSGA